MYEAQITTLTSSLQEKDRFNM
jgi:hypothetical protein